MYLRFFYWTPHSTLTTPQAATVVAVLLLSWTEKNQSFLTLFFNPFLVVVISGGFTNVIPAKCKEVTTNVFMFWAGLGSIVVPFLCPIIGMKMETVTRPTEIGKSI